VAAFGTGRTEHFPQELTGCDSCHDDHGTDGDILKRHRQSFAFAASRHELGLRAKVVKIVFWGYGHRTAPTLSGLVSAAGSSAMAVVVSVDSLSGVRLRDDMWKSSLSIWGLVVNPH
jgi:hypothetical protein